MTTASKNLYRLKAAAAAVRVLLAAAAPLAVGCMPSQTPVRVAAPDVPYLRDGEIDRFVAGSEKPTLLEFCVPAGCFRCDKMRPLVNDLAQNEADRVTVRRVNLNKERRLAAEWGVTVCPTYIMVTEGREVGRSQYPTSADLIAAMIPRQRGTDSSDPARSEANLEHTNY